MIRSDQTPWAGRAACLGMDTELFFPRRAEQVPPEVRDACNRCPVRGPCLDYALPRFDLLGVWGGTSALERKQMRRQR